MIYFLHFFSNVALDVFHHTYHASSVVASSVIVPSASVAVPSTDFVFPKECEFEFAGKCILSTGAFPDITMYQVQVDYTSYSDPTYVYDKTRLGSLFQDSIINQRGLSRYVSLTGRQFDKYQLTNWIFDQLVSPKGRSFSSDPNYVIKLYCRYIYPYKYFNMSDVYRGQFYTDFYDTLHVASLRSIVRAKNVLMFKSKSENLSWLYC